MVWRPGKSLADLEGGSSAGSRNLTEKGEREDVPGSGWLGQQGVRRGRHRGGKAEAVDDRRDEGIGMRLCEQCVSKAHPRNLALV